MTVKELSEKFEFREIRPDEAEQAAKIEQICFPPNEACTEKMMRERVAAVPDLFLVAVDKEKVDKCIKAALSARMNAYTPYSEYKVGAAVLSASSGRIYKGCNIENSSYGATICAERNAVTTALAAEGALGIDLLVVASEDYPPAPRVLYACR